MNSSQPISSAKPHFAALDGLRGIAALAVVIFHFMEWAFAPEKNFISHGFLAVDFFFCLSGFVIAYAYDDRLAKIGIFAFFRARIIRLHPLVILGSILGLIAFFFDPFSSDASSYSQSRVFLLFLASAFLIPMPTMADRSFNLFGLNAPSWSLFWEYIANIAYALILSKIKRSTLIILTILAAIALTFVAIRSHNLLGGWNGTTFWDGCARISFSFLAGLLIFRANWIWSNRLSFFLLSLLLTLCFLLPSTSWNWLTELLVVVLVFPLLVSLAAGTILTPRIRTFCQFSGQISYPLYMTHYAALWIFGHYYTTHKVSNSQLALIITLSVPLLILLAYLAMKLYDLPVRQFLTRKFSRPSNR